MIDIKTEQMLTLNEAAKRIPGRNGSCINISTMWRWTLRGIRGIRLESIRIGGIRRTSVEALDRFVAECSGASTPPSVPSKCRAKEIDRAEKECTALGV